MKQGAAATAIGFLAVALYAPVTGARWSAEPRPRHPDAADAEHCASYRRIVPFGGYAPGDRALGAAYHAPLLKVAVGYRGTPDRHI